MCYKKPVIFVCTRRFPCAIFVHKTPNLAAKFLLAICALPVLFQHESGRNLCQEQTSGGSFKRLQLLIRQTQHRRRERIESRKAVEDEAAARIECLAIALYLQWRKWRLRRWRPRRDGLSSALSTTAQAETPGDAALRQLYSSTAMVSYSYIASTPLRLSKKHGFPADLPGRLFSGTLCENGASEPPPHWLSVEDRKSNRERRDPTTHIYGDAVLVAPGWLVARDPAHFSCEVTTEILRSLRVRSPKCGSGFSNKAWSVQARQWMVRRGAAFMFGTKLCECFPFDWGPNHMRYTTLTFFFLCYRKVNLNLDQLDTAANFLTFNSAQTQISRPCWRVNQRAYWLGGGWP
ncbi:hypothetical protein C8R47DRAFT_1200860, partial [Mycena vitilis]